MRRIKNISLNKIETSADLIKAIDTYKRVTKNKGIVFFDTETTGLNIKYDSPFLLPWGFLNPTLDHAYIYCVDVDVDNAKRMEKSN